MSYLDSYKRKRSVSANRSSSRNDTKSSCDGTRVDGYSGQQRAIEQQTEIDDKHKALMRENKLRRERIEREAKLKEEERKIKAAEALNERKKEQKTLYNKYFKPNNQYAEKIDRSLR